MHITVSGGQKFVQTTLKCSICMQNVDFKSNFSKMIKCCHFSFFLWIKQSYHIFIFTGNICNSLLHDHAPMLRVQTSLIRPSLSFL